MSTDKNDGRNLPAKPPEIVFLDAAGPYVTRWLDNQRAETERQERTDSKAIDVRKEVTLSQMRDRRWYLWAGVSVLFAVLIFAWAVKDPRIAVDLILAAAGFGAGWFGGKGAARREQ